MITFEEFKSVDLRTAEVLSAVPHPNADRLLVLRVDIGELGERQIVAGIRPYYDPEDLEGMILVVVANLEPTTIRGVESEGMLLAVVGDDEGCVITTDAEMPSGLQVT